MDNIKAKTGGENRNGDRIPVESGTTVIIHSGDREIIGTIEDKSEGGLGVKIPEASKQYLQQDTMMTMTYSMPYGLVSQSAQVCWSHSDKAGELTIGTSFLETDAGFQTDYHKLWKDFIAAEKLEDAARFWLSLQSAMISGVTRGVVVLGKPESEAYTPVAFWPEGQSGAIGLTEVAELALQEKRGILRDEGHINQELDLRVCYIGFPLMSDDKLYGVVAIEIAVRSENLMRAVMRQLQWGAAWIELIIRRIDGKKYTPENQQLVTVLELVATSLQHDKFHAAATSVVTELAILLECERVSIGFLKGKYIQVKALSHSADFAKKSKLVQSLGLAMDEAMDQQTSLVCPAYEGDAVKILKCHEKLLQEQGTGSVCTIPLSNKSEVFGALTLERATGQLFVKSTVELCETIASLIGPILEAKRKEDLWVITKLGLSLKDFVSNLIGPANAGLKMMTFLFLSVLLFFAVAVGDFRITADTYLEGSIQRVIVTPFDGYISEAFVRAGDVVKEGSPLVKLDDNDLILERAKWASQKTQYLKEYRDALGKSERSKVSVLKAQLSQVDAQLAMVDAQLSRIRLNAPFDGIIVSGDLSQSLGSPSQRGEVLFEIAPLEAYRVILEVDERDISMIKIAQTGELVLTGHSDKVITFKVNSVTPVSEVKEGRNYFKVEAILEQKIDSLRPGMKGVGKILIGERHLIWIWSRPFVDWLRLSLWTWWPQGL
jgi:hypothetical protein